MGKIILAGGMGAVVNCALALHFSTSSADHVLQQLVGHPLSALRSLLVLPAALGFLIGTVILLGWTFIYAMVLRFLLGYNGWFLHPKRPINKVWYLLMLALLGKENRGAGNYQQFLPSLPVPPLKATCKRYLDSVRPLQTAEEYRETESAVKEFQQGEGKKLQFFLKLRSLFFRNWLNDWWLDYIYLRQRTPIAFNSNYFVLGSKNYQAASQLDRAAMVVYLGVQGAKKLCQGKDYSFMAQAVVPFCMDGVRYLSSTSRIPGREIDRISNYDHRQIRHVVVLRNGKFYKMDIMSEDGRILPPFALKKQLEKIVAMAGDELDQTGVMAFTAQSRTKWAEIRERMEKHPLNKETLKTIDSSSFVFSLESEIVDKHDLTLQARAAFHGNMFNRWFDKSCLVAIYGSDVVIANVEHSPLDATVCGQIWEYIMMLEEYDEEGHIPVNMGDREFPIAEPSQLCWKLDEFAQDLQEAKDNLRDMIDDSDLVVVAPSYGKRFAKKCRLSPDGWIQMALQLAYYRSYGKLVLTYESATTRLYYKGRTETIRPVSDQSKAFVQAMDDPAVPREEVKRLFKEGISYQEKYKFEAMRGMGIDRHLFGLYIVAKGMKMDPLPRIFRDKAFQFSFTLSTSQTPVRFTKRWRQELSSPAGGFGTATEDGYGVSYIVASEDEVNFSVHSKKSCPTTDSTSFGNAICKAMEDLKELYQEYI